MWVLAAYVLAAGILLLSPIGPGRVLGAVIDWIRGDLGVSGFRQGWIEAPANVLLFIPLGLLLTLLFRRPWIGLVVAVLLSIGAEVVQMVLPGRLSSLRDIVANALGAALGAAIAWLVLRRRRRISRHPSPGSETTRAE